MDTEKEDILLGLVESAVNQLLFEYKICNLFGKPPAVCLSMAFQQYQSKLNRHMVENDCSMEDKSEVMAVALQAYKILADVVPKYRGGEGFHEVRYARIIRQNKILRLSFM